MIAEAVGCHKGIRDIFIGTDSPEFWHAFSIPKFLMMLKLQRGIITVGLLSFSLQFKDPCLVHLSITATTSKNDAYWGQISWEPGKQIPQAQN